MFWMLVVICVAAISYAVSVLSEYTAFLKDIGPRMSRLRKQADNLDQIIKAESVEVEVLGASLPEEKNHIEDMHSEIVTIQNELKQAHKRERDLEMKAYKQEFRMSKKRA